MAPSPLARLRRLCLALPDTAEVEAWGEPTFRVKGKIFAMHASPSNHHGGARESVWVKAMAENQRIMVQAEPHRYFVPPYVGPSGWIGVWIDGDADWNELAEMLKDAWRRTAPKRVVAAFDAGAAAPATRTATAAKQATARRATARKPTAKKAVKRAAVKKAAKKAAGKKTAPKPTARPAGPARKSARKTSAR